MLNTYKGVKRLTKKILSVLSFLDDMPTSSNDPELSLLYGNMDENKWYENIFL